MSDSYLPRHTKVVKTTGDYSFKGEVIDTITKLDGTSLRYVVEDSRGLLLILKRSQFLVVPS